VPVCGMCGGEGPLNGLPAQPGLNMAIASDVSWIVIADKFVVRSGVIDNQSQEKQKQGGYEPAFLRSAKNGFFDPRRRSNLRWGTDHT
jgi:hypothetical protein